MTTSQHFFLKLFDANDKAKPYYKDLSFKQFSNDEIKFIDKLTIMSKYKDYIKQFFCRSHAKKNEKKTYILSYKSLLSYEDYIKYDSSVDMLEQKTIDSFYLFGIGSKFY